MEPPGTDVSVGDQVREVPVVEGANGRPDAILFDFDGVLADSEPVHWECWREVLGTVGLDLTWDYYERECIGVSDREMLLRLGKIENPPRPLDELWPLYPHKQKIFRERVKDRPIVQQPTRRTVKSLSDIRIGLVTSSISSEIEPILKNEGIFDCFAACVYGDRVTNLKPHPEPYLLAQELIGAKRAIVLEDSEAGLESARSAGCQVIAVKHPSEVPAIVESVLATYFR